jgi:flagellar biosynthesis component FlhA
MNISIKFSIRILKAISMVSLLVSGLYILGGFALMTTISNNVSAMLGQLAIVVGMPFTFFFLMSAVLYGMAHFLQHIRLMTENAILTQQVLARMTDGAILDERDENYHGVLNQQHKGNA